MTPRFSFEFFPPKSVNAAFRLAAAVDNLKGFEPEFMSITCGTGGGSVALTDETIAAVGVQSASNVAPHITCTGRSLSDLKAQIAEYAKSGVTTAVALRGDGPADAALAPTRPHTPCVVDLVAALAETGISPLVAAYPETHPKAANAQADLDALKAKQDAGAVAAISQFFFDGSTFLRFRDRAVAQGITLDLIPGILPVVNWRATKRMADACGTSVSPDVAEGFARADRENRAALMATAHASELCDQLHRAGVNHFHIYTLNTASVPAAICAAMGANFTAPLRNVA